MVSAPSLEAGPSPALILAGTTAAGKTALALRLAIEAGSAGSIEIINADSLLVYRGMDLGTAKPTTAERGRVPHHLIDVRDPDEPFTAGDFCREVERLRREIDARGHRSLLVGGTGFYLRALLFGLWDAPASSPELREELERRTLPELFAELRAADPASAERIGPADHYRLLRAVEVLRTSGGKTPTLLEAENRARPPVANLLLGWLDRSDAELSSRIRKRTEQMVRGGLLDEVHGLTARYPGARPLKAVGYRECVRHLSGEKPAGRKIEEGEAGLIGEIELATRQLVKKQRTFFRGLEARRLGQAGATAAWIVDPESWPAARARFMEIYAK